VFGLDDTNQTSNEISVDNVMQIDIQNMSHTYMNKGLICESENIAICLGVTEMQEM